MRSANATGGAPARDGDAPSDAADAGAATAAVRTSSSTSEPLSWAQRSVPAIGHLPGSCPTRERRAGRGASTVPEPGCLAAARNIARLREAESVEVGSAWSGSDHQKETPPGHLR